jgi:hypothetical protein
LRAIRGTFGKVPKEVIEFNCKGKMNYANRPEYATFLRVAQESGTMKLARMQMIAFFAQTLRHGLRAMAGEDADPHIRLDMEVISGLIETLASENADLSALVFERYYEYSRVMCEFLPSMNEKAGKIPPKKDHHLA